MADHNSIGKILQNARNAQTELPTKKERGRPKGKRSDPTYTQFSALIPIKLHQMVKIALISNPDVKDLSQLIEILLQEWIEKQDIYSYLASKQKSD